MPDIGGSIEDNITSKLGLLEIPESNRVRTLLNYLYSILDGKTKSSPIELKALLGILEQYQQQDSAGDISRFFRDNALNFKLFFRNNFAKFDRFEFKAQLDLLKGGTEFEVPINARRNFSSFKKIDLKPYIQILESNPKQLAEKVASTQRSSYDEQLKQQEAMRLEHQRMLKEIQNQIKIDIDRSGMDVVKGKVNEVVENCIPAIQIKYNEKALRDLNQYVLADDLVSAISGIDDIFDSLMLSVAQRERFFDLLRKKTMLKE